MRTNRDVEQFRRQSQRRNQTPKSTPKTVEIYGRIKRKTEKAVLIDDESMEVWLPLSQIVISEPNRYRDVTITLPEWLAEKKGVI